MWFTLGVRIGALTIAVVAAVSAAACSSGSESGVVVTTTTAHDATTSTRAPTTTAPRTTTTRDPADGPLTLRVPSGRYPTIQDAIDAALDGDTIIVSPGIHGPVVIEGVNVRLASTFLTSGDPADIADTIIDGAGGDAAVFVADTDETTRIMGFTIRNADDGVRTRNALLRFTDNVVTETNDGIDFESTDGGVSGGLVRDSVFERNGDDGIDLDDAVVVRIERSVIRDNGDDGIEIRLHGYEGDRLDVAIRRNRITDNGEDGIQFIGYPEPSNRRFVIEGNLIRDNALAGVGMLDNGDTDEDFRGAPVPDPIRVRNNTFVANGWAFSGGADVTFEQNVVTDSALGGVRNVAGTSIVRYSAFWNNPEDIVGSRTGDGLLFVDPLLGPDDVVRAASPVIDAGRPGCNDPDGSVCDMGWSGPGGEDG